ncbi:MAG: ATP-binding protein [Deltaproteobacteria bacterium]|nr:ATP-binding protein [Deltaproteobacteria bacterium]
MNTRPGLWPLSWSAVNNAVEALEGRGHVFIKLDGDQNHAILTIADNGKGIDPKVLPNLMKEGASFGKPDGNGLGLYHAKKTMDSMGGTIEIGSVKGRGTVVKLHVPFS